MLLLLFSLDRQLSIVDSVMSFIGGVVYTLSLTYQSRKLGTVPDEFTEEYSFSDRVTSNLWLKNIVFIVGGLALLVWVLVG